MQHHVVRYLSPVEFSHVELARLVALIEAAFAPAIPTFQFRDWGVGGTVRANTLQELLDHPDLSASMCTLRVTARCTDEDLGTAKIDVLFDNARPLVRVEASLLPWAEATADKIRSFSLDHRPWHFFMHGRIGAVLVCLAVGSVGLFVVQLAERMQSGTVSLDFVSMWLAIFTASIAICFAGILLRR